MRQQQSKNGASIYSAFNRWKALNRLRAVNIALVNLLLIGCQGEVPAPSPAAGDPTTSKTAAQQDAPSLPNPEMKDTGASSPFELESDFRLITLDDFDQFAAEPETWKATGEGFVCSGKPRGYLYSKQSYQDFTWRFDYRFPRPQKLKDDVSFKGNTGFLVYITGEHKLWPMCLEVQGKYVQMAAVKENGGAQPVTVEDDENARRQARTPVGQWNAIEIVSKSGELRVFLNGTQVAHSQPDFLSDGLIGVQSEDHPFEVRRMRIRRE